MVKIYEGKTKDVYKNKEGNYVLKFKDDVTGTDGVFDPGANTVGLKIHGAGRAGLKLTKFFFEKINQSGILTHYIDANIEEATMTVKPATLFGKGVEVILRYRGVGSFYRRYASVCKEGQAFPDGYVEVTLKDDDRNDPLITKEGLVVLEIMSEEEFDHLVQMTKAIGEIVKGALKDKGLTLYDIKFEFGRIGTDQQIALIDEISGGNMRAYKGDQYIEPLQLEKILLEK